VVQRYYNANYGRFWTPDPVGLEAVNLKNPTSWNMYAYVNDDPVDFNDPTGTGDLTLPCPPLKNCITRGLQVVGGVFQATGGAALVGASVVGEVGSGGLSTLASGFGVLAGAGQVVGGLGNVWAGITGSVRAANTAQNVSNLTNPAGFVATVLTSNQDTATGASMVFNLSALVGGFANLVATTTYGVATEWQAGQVLAGLYLSTPADILTAASTLPAALPTVYTPPVEVDGGPVPVPYYEAPMDYRLVLMDEN